MTAAEILDGVLDDVADIVNSHPECKVDGDECQACHLRREVVGVLDEALFQMERLRLLEAKG